MENDKLIVLSEISANEKKLVQNQLNKILNSTYFSSSKQKQRFLEYVVGKTIAGEGNLLKQYTIGVEALDLPDDFDSDSNPVVRIMGGRVRNRLNDYYEDTNDNEILIDIPKGTYTPEFSYITNQRKASTTNLKEVPKATGPRLGVFSFSDKTQSSISNRLLFQTTDDLAHQLSRSVFFNLIVNNPYGDKSESHLSGEDLEADYLLSLYVQELSENDFKLVFRLTKTGTEETLHSDSIDLESESSISNQNNILGRLTDVITDMLQGKLHPHWARQLLLDKDNIPDNYKALAYYRQYYDELTFEAFAEAISVFEDALAKNPNDIIVNILFSELCKRDYSLGYDIIDSPLKRGIECAELVTHLRPDSHEAHFTLGQLFYSQNEWQRSTEHLNKARELAQSYGVIEYATGFYFCLMGKWDEGLVLVKNAIGLSNYYPSWYHTPISLSFYVEGHYEKALFQAKKIIAPNLPHGPLTRCIAHAKLGNEYEAKKEYRELSKTIHNFNKNGKEGLYRLLGNKELVTKVWEGIEIAINVK